MKEGKGEKDEGWDLEREEEVKSFCRVDFDARLRSTGERRGRGGKAGRAGEGGREVGNGE